MEIYIHIYVAKLDLSRDYTQYTLMYVLFMFSGTSMEFQHIFLKILILWP